jgi:hypothetical protein
LYVNRGITYAVSGQLKLALQDLEKFLELNPDTPDRERIEGMIQQLKNDIAAGNSAAFWSIFLASSFSCSQAESTPALVVEPVETQRHAT